MVATLKVLGFDPARIMTVNPGSCSVNPIYSLIQCDTIDICYYCLQIMSTDTPTDPPPDYAYAVTHPPDQCPPEYSVAASLPSYQQAILDKGNT